MLRRALSSSSSTFASRRPTVSRFNLPALRNEPMLDYAPGSAERAALKEALARLRGEKPHIPLVIGGEEVVVGAAAEHGVQYMPSDRTHALATYSRVAEEHARAAIDAAQGAKEAWESMAWEDRAGIFLRAADLASTKYRAELCAATMLGASKNVWQAEIDTAAELADFWRFGVAYVHDIYAQQPAFSSQHTWNRLEYRPLEGFVLAVSPFNFTAIGGNLPSAPAMCGNTVLWKPAENNLLANWVVFRILREAGLPDGVVNFLPGHGAPVGNVAFAHPDFAGLHFTGSTAVFQDMWREVGTNVHRYRTYPRLVGETGGKNFHFVHESADPRNVVNQTVRSAFEYQGQKCSACSRAYVPRSMWPEVRDGIVSALAGVKVGQPDEMDSFMCAVIDEKSFRNLAAHIDRARESASCEIVAGGGYDDSRGWFVQPTVIVTTDPNYETMSTELFGPVLTVYVYENEQFEETLRLCDGTSQYALTGAIFSEDREALARMSSALRNAAGNFYVNDKSTGAVVGQQPFGGARGSGTNDKAGAPLNMLRWMSPRTIKEAQLRIDDYKYPHMAEPEK